MPTADANFSFPQTCRLKSSQQIKDVVLQRQSVFRYPIKCFYSIPETPGESACRIAFIVPNKPCSKSLKSLAVSVDLIEALTGYDFFSRFPDDVQKLLQEESRFRDWFDD